MSLDQFYFLHSVGGRAIHYAPDRNHLHPLLDTPRPDFHRLLLFSSEESAQRYADRVNLGPSFYKVSVSSVADLLYSLRKSALPQKYRPSYYLEPKVKEPAEVSCSA